MTKVTDMQYLYKIGSNEAIPLCNDWLEAFKKKYACKECQIVLPQTYEKAVDVCLQKKAETFAMFFTTSYFTTSISAHIMRKDFFELFANEMRQLNVGKVCLKTESIVLHDYVSVVGYPRLRIRGGPESQMCPCPVCGNPRYRASDPCYILRKTIINQSIYISTIGGIIVTEELAKRIGKKKWKGIYIQKIPIRDEPIDSFGDIEMP